ncbi:MAG: acyl-CoA dehydrogenase family protein [Xanthomonadales bacterium]|nr:acyl-CoA dehydrogenase family protein [Xanthomonadales bacterium]MCP5473978.1 acyl-CoA dehydrogenase family protein [Rhodanobacteraceae bacterium]
MGFTQTPPQLSNPYLTDRVLQSVLRRAMPPALFEHFHEEANELGQVIADELYPQQLRERQIEPVHTPFDPWGRRIDHIELTPLWKAMPQLATRFGLVWHGYDQSKGAHARLFQFGMVYLASAASDFYTCPLAMTDGAARALVESGNSALVQRALPHLTAREAHQLWTSGQWMTETSGGSDVGGTETRAEVDADGQWRVHGRKWFTSAATSEMALLLARPAGNAEGTDGLALFYCEPRDRGGRLQNITIDRLKDKLGSRKLPTAELRLDGTPVELVGEPSHGVRMIAPVLNQTRVWNALAALSVYRRGLQLLRDYAARRRVFGRMLREQPLHQHTLAGLQAEFEAGLHLSLYVAEMLGKSELGLLDDRHRLLLRLLIPITKLLTARQTVAGISEIVEGFGGAGYIEDTGLPALLRDAQVFSIWEGTTNVLSLDALKILSSDHTWSALHAALVALLSQTGSEFDAIATQIRDGYESAYAALHHEHGANRGEAFARGIAMTLGRCFALAVLLRHAAWSLRAEGDPRPAAAARRFSAHGLICLQAGEALDSRILAIDELE